MALPKASNCRSAAFAMLLAPLLTAVAWAVTADAFRFVCSTKSCVFSTCVHPCGAIRATRRIQRLDRFSDSRGMKLVRNKSGGRSRVTDQLQQCPDSGGPREKDTRERFHESTASCRMSQGCDVPSYLSKTCFGAFLAKKLLS